MREIKFRFVEKENNVVREITHIDFELNIVRLITGREAESNWVLQDEFSFENIELMQYTGLKDKNGVEIYEGDIVKYKGYDDYIYKVVFVETECRFFALGVTKTQSENNLGYKINNRLKVIGNIYENGNLLWRYVTNAELGSITMKSILDIVLYAKKILSLFIRDNLKSKEIKK